MASTGTVTINIVGDADRFRGALNDAEGGLSKFQSKLRGLGTQMMSFGSTMTTHVTLPIVGAFALATKAAIDEQQEIAKLDQVLKNSTAITTEQRKAVEKQITAWQNATGIADGQLRPALSNLIVAGYDWVKAQKLMAVAMDIAVAKGLSVESVTKAMARAATGNTTALSRMGIAVKDLNGDALTFDQILQNASETMGGSAARAADTAAGRMAILRARFRDSVEELGNNLIPIFEQVVAVVGKVIDKFNGLTPTQQKLIVGFLGLAAVVGPLIVTLGAFAAAISAISLPVLAVVAAVVAVTAAIIAMWVKWDEIWNFMANHPAIALVVSILYAPIAVLFLIIGALKALYENWDTVWNFIRNLTSSVWDVIRPIFERFKGALDEISSVIQFLSPIVSECFHSMTVAIVAFWNVVDGPLHALLNVLQRTIGLLNELRNIGGSGFGIGDIVGPAVPGGELLNNLPGRAIGGPVLAGSPYIVGERGPELFVPKQSGQVVPNGAMGGMVVNATIVAPDPESAADALVRRLRTEAFLAGM